MDHGCSHHVPLKTLKGSIYANTTLIDYASSMKSHCSELSSSFPISCAIFQHNMKFMFTSIVDMV